MHKLYILLSLFTLSSSITFANYKIDSIGVENNKGKKLIIHKVEAKETYYSLAKKYNVNFKDIMTFNDSKFLQIGVIIKVPTEIDFAPNAPAAKVNNADAIEYTIKAKDNLNMLAERYGTTVDEIKRVNGLKSINLQIGQVLKIPNAANVNEKVAEPETKIVVNPPTATKTTVENKVVVNENASVVEHTIKAKENLNMLAEKYGTTVDEIKRLNGLNSNNLRIGQVLKIASVNGTAAPVVENAPQNEAKNVVKKEVTNTKSNIADGSFEHIVIAGETIYSIAQKYGLTTYQLKTFANLTSNDVNVGQKLIIKGPKSVAVQSDEEESTGTGTNTIKDPSLKYAPSRYGLTQFEEKGTAVWIADQDLDASKMLVLHRTAPVGTVIKITNPMSNRTTYAKVVGKFTENESTKDVIIVMTKAVADAVGALDKRFFCNITYGAQENEQQK